jgi:hypothetical protein
MDESVQNGVQLEQTFESDTAVLGTQAKNFVSCVSPYLSLSDSEAADYIEADSANAVAAMRFFRLTSCTTEKVDNLADYLKEKMDKLFTALYSLDMPIVYGIISDQGKTNLVIGVNSTGDGNIIDSLLKGLLTGIELTSYEPEIESKTTGGIISAIPVVKLENDKQKFDISTLMKSLNGKSYTVLFFAKPYSKEWVQKKYAEIVEVRDACFAVSKRNVARQESQTDTTGTSKTVTQTHTFGAVLKGVFYSYSTGKSTTENISKAIGTSNAVSHDIQNGIALEMMEYCDKAIERLRQGQNIGMWGTTITYTANDQTVANIIKSCLCGELAKASTDILPLRQFEYSQWKEGQGVLIPQKWKEGQNVPMSDGENPLLAPITSSELGMVCTPPFEPVPDFELKQGKIYPMISSPNDGVIIGKVSDGHRPLDNMNFSLSEKDLNKHTFICGITGSGKTTTVKGILCGCKKPFMVIESAKKEYRNLKLPDDREDKEITVYTLGKTEINSLRFNPFYVQCGINLQTHIDFLKDLFNASFSFYGPMPYILEKCLHNIYQKKGWNLTLGYHPFLINQENREKVFEQDYMQGKYALKSHKYLFPTMQDLKEEVKRYIEQEMQYDGEVGGNVKTAILARLESLCVGSKGFMFNTNEAINMKDLLQKNVVFELEGLSDDSDKAFCVGLLLVFINEYRQVIKEQQATEAELGLQHLLVIEEAHRLLKNVETERLSENMGNPKGKAVEHFTNMIAEMRSYGQGVIVAEQIPSKLAPDVIKNSSNKIIQRVVSADDQALVANTIGIKEEDAVYLGSLKTGVALCHKEGMSLPVFVEVNNVLDNVKIDADIARRRDGAMYDEINHSLVKEHTSGVIDDIGLKLLNTLLVEEPGQVVSAIQWSRALIDRELVKQGVSLIMCRDRKALYGDVLTETIIQYLSQGTYRLGDIVSDELYEALTRLLQKGRKEDVDKVRDMLKDGYKQECRNRCSRIISELIKSSFDNTVNVQSSIRQYFYTVPDALVTEIADKIAKEVP